MVESFNPPGLWVPFGPFSMAALQGDGQILHLKGQVALDAEGEIVGRGDMRAQVRKALENIRAVLRAFGGEMRDILALSHYVTDIEAFLKTGDIRREFFTDPYPVTTTLGVAALYHPDLYVEITALAEVPRDRFRRPI